MLHRKQYLASHLHKRKLKNRLFMYATIKHLHHLNLFNYMYYECVSLMYYTYFLCTVNSSR